MQVIHFCLSRLSKFRTGGVLALGLGSGGWTATDCERNLVGLLRRSFSSKSHRRLPGVSLRRRQYRSWKYHSGALEDCLKELLTNTQCLGDQPVGPLPDYRAHVGVRTYSVGEYQAMLTNYPFKNTHSDLKLWET
jgi:hypothetical protein